MDFLTGGGDGYGVGAWGGVFWDSEGGGEGEESGEEEEGRGEVHSLSFVGVGVGFSGEAWYCGYQRR